MDIRDEKKDKKDEFEFKGTYQKKYENIKNLLQSALNQIEKVQNAIETLEQEERKNHYQSIPGTEGVYDGQFLVAQDGRKTEVPTNYAAKSKLVYGDILKVFTDSGKQIFKQIDRVERKKIEGVLTKKEGKWYLLSDIGSYRVSDSFVEFNSAQLNDKASALIPAENIKVPFATLDSIYKDSGTVEERKDSGIKDAKNFKKKSFKKPASHSPEKIPEPKKEVVPPSSSGSIKIKKDDKKVSKPIAEVEKNNKEYVVNIMEDDDLR